MTCLEGGKWDSVPIECKPICGRLTSKSVSLIVGGADAGGITQAPWQAAIYRKTKGSYKLDCGGSILTKRIVISAGHCFFKDDSQSWSPKENYKIVIGKYLRKYDANETHSTQSFDIAELRTVSGFNGYSGFYISDISLIILDGEIDFQPHILPICIDLNVRYGLDRVVMSGEIGVVSGWGNTHAAGKPSKTLKSIELPVVDFQQCEEEAEDFKRFITPDKFCAGFRNGSGVCKGLFNTLIQK